MEDRSGQKSAGEERQNGGHFQPPGQPLAENAQDNDTGQKQEKVVFHKISEKVCVCINQIRLKTPLQKGQKPSF